MPDKNIIETEIEYLKGVGPARANLLKKELGIFTFGDLLNYFPFRYIDRTKFTPISQLNPESGLVQLRGYFSHIELIGNTYQKRLQANFRDNTGNIQTIWFQGHKWIQEKIYANTEFVIMGKVGTFNNRLNISHPEFMTIEEFKNAPYSGKMQAVYNTSEKLKSRNLDSQGIGKIVRAAIEKCQNQLPETLPEYILKSLNLPQIEDAYKNIHTPQNYDLIDRSRKRFKFEEALYLQLQHKISLSTRHNKKCNVVFKSVGEKFNYFYKNNLAFELTGAQKKVIKEIHNDLNSGFKMNRLLQGDVGSGKTLVALMAMLLATDNNYQACMMAPTEILAQQHYTTICELLTNMNVEISLLTGSTKAKERRIILENLLSGKTQIIVGTHALIEDPVIFKNLGIAIIDEQHRFGVKQRAKLQSKNKDDIHVLVMTATPIPRTLALSAYGDLDISVIDELPKGRKPIKTIFFDDSSRSKAISLMRMELSKKRQIYVVYPLINESEKSDLLALEKGYEILSDYFPFPDYHVEMLHGKMKAQEKDSVMNDFINGKINILVSTTVIEVGVNVPNASVMIIENAERFGLAQLHQLRGRVGRGAEQSYCVLMGGEKISTIGKQRLDTMLNSNDGFFIAEQDMKLRGPGDINGTRQSGDLEFKFLDLYGDTKIIIYAKKLASQIIDSDPRLDLDKNKELKIGLTQRNGKSYFADIA